MCLHPNVIDALAAAGASSQMIAAAYRAAWALENSAASTDAAVKIPPQAADEIRTGPLATATNRALRGGEHPSREDEKRDAARVRQQRRRDREKSKATQTEMFPVTLVTSRDSVTSERDVTEPQRKVSTPLKETTSLRSVEERGGGGNAREPLVLISQEAVCIADEIATIAGLDPTDPLATPPGWCGAAARVQAWLAHWTRETIIAGVRAGMWGKRDGPPETPRYFEKPIARIHLQLSAPIPVAPEVSYVQARDHRPAGGWQESRDAFRAARAELHATVVAFSGGGR